MMPYAEFLGSRSLPVYSRRPSPRQEPRHIKRVLVVLITVTSRGKPLENPLYCLKMRTPHYPSTMKVEFLLRARTPMIAVINVAVGRSHGKAKAVTIISKGARLSGKALRLLRLTLGLAKTAQMQIQNFTTSQSSSSVKHPTLRVWETSEREMTYSWKQDQILTG